MSPRLGGIVLDGITPPLLIVGAAVLLFGARQLVARIGGRAPGARTDFAIVFAVIALAGLLELAMGRTPATSENPVFTLGVVEVDSAPRGADRSIRYGGHYYAVAPDAGYQWNKKAFLLLYQLFEMTVVKLPQGAGPSITIAK